MYVKCLAWYPVASKNLNNYYHRTEIFSAFPSFTHLWWSGAKDEETSHWKGLIPPSLSQLSPYETKAPVMPELLPFQEKPETCIFKYEIA